MPTYPAYPLNVVDPTTTALRLLRSVSMTESHLGRQSLPSRSESRENGILILWGKVDTTTVDEARLNDWWTNEHLPERLSLPGFLRARRYYGDSQEDGSRSYLACYEASSSASFTSVEYMHALNNPTAQTKMFMPHLAKMNRSSCNVHQSWKRHVGLDAIGNWLVAATFRSDKRDMFSSDDSIRAFGKSMFDTHSGILNIHILQYDRESTRQGNASSSYDGVRFEDKTTQPDEETYIALIDCSLPMVHDSLTVLSELESAISLVEHLLGDKISTWDAYQLLTTLIRRESKL